MPSPSLLSNLPPLVRELLVGCIILVAVVVSRHATLDHPIELSGDESELLVQIDRYEHDLMPWRSVDGSTIGPANPWFLLLIKQTGWPMTYAGIHLLAALLLGTIAVASYAAVRIILPFPAACLVGLAGIIALGCSASINFMYYATELLPALAQIVAVFALLWAGSGRPAALSLLLLAAFCSGVAPWAKLQAAPISLLLCGFIAWIAWTRVAAGLSPARKIATVVLATGVAALPGLVIVGAVCLGGIFPDFWASYIVANLGYAGDFTLTAATSRLGQLLQLSQLNGLIAATAALVIFCLATARARRSMPDRQAPWLGWLAALFLSAAVYACIRPPYGFGHYHLFLIGPLLVALGVLVRLSGLGQPGSSGRRRGPALVAAACLLAPTGILSVFHYASGESLRDYLAAMRRDAAGSLPAVVTREIKRLAPQAKTLVVWGWMPTFYVEAKLRSATRHPIGHFLIDAGPRRAFLRQQFLGDVEAARPDVIIDAVASDCFTWYWPVASSGLESFPEFATYVRANYDLVLSVTGDQAGVPLRVFVRKPADNRRD